MKTIKALKEEIAAKQKELADIFEEARTDEGYDLSKVTKLEGDNAQKAAEIKRRNEELAGLGEELDEVRDIEAADEQVKKISSWLNDPVDHPGHPAPGNGKGDEKPPVKSLGELFVESDAFKKFDGRQSPTAELKDIELKTLFQTTAGWAPETVRGPRVELTPERALVVADLPMVTETSQAALKYMEETTKTPAAAETAEAGAYPEAAFALTERSSTVRKIAVFLPITDEQFEDEPRARDYVNQRLVRAINERLDSQLLVGDGVAPNLTGIANVTGIQTQAKGADPVFDAVFKAMTLVRHTGFAEPDALVFNPNDWQDARLLRTADGIYILGNPSEPGPERLFAKSVVMTSAQTEGTAIVGAFRDFSDLAIRRGLEIKVSDSHSDYFVNGKLAVRADFRAAFVVYRPKAFCTVTGI